MWDKMYIGFIIKKLQNYCQKASETLSGGQNSKSSWGDEHIDYPHRTGGGHITFVNYFTWCVDHDHISTVYRR